MLISGPSQGSAKTYNAEFLIRYADKHGPITVRGLYYQAEVAGVEGIDKDESGYLKVQRQVLQPWPEQPRQVLHRQRRRRSGQAARRPNCA